MLNVFMQAHLLQNLWLVMERKHCLRIVPQAVAQFCFVKNYFDFKIFSSMFELRHEKTNHLNSKQVRHKTELCKRRRWLEAENIGFRKYGRGIVLFV